MSFIESPTEAAWLQHWTTAVADGTADGNANGDANGNADTAELAARAGAGADRLAWVFMSGYQGAVRACFPEFAGPGWSCFAAAEAKDAPPCVLAPAADGHRLHGSKSWVAGARSLARLVVSVGEGDARRFVCVARDAPGLVLSEPRAPSFLAELSQGAATFEDVAVGADQLLADPVRAHWFRAAEPLHVLIALNACLGAQAASAGDSSLALTTVANVDLGAGLVPEIHDRVTVKAGLTELRARTTEVVRQFAEGPLAHAVPALGRSWETDARLLTMFGVSGAEA
ncbi:MAG TPA: hypothetical protein VLA56_21445 [Pseudomonadales bacterium]|nr:hypothetical protein [Pseudomonadales bacterium]